ncbi:tRNA (adenosine(37)-N6)-dimethylallyltransferase MiaA [bacterium]|nr:tRNA (adenosine(37)-N6)-dimethylallyltransferase MiaA [bacterium]MBU2462452.1 tRNA (adenosine(37)-N6)-dimethylallyltransferase MiaA [bacterium]
MTKALQPIIITGPTASGKTEISHRFAKDLGGEIISADSRQIFRFMDIGTVKPSKSYQGEISYHLIDIVNPDEPFTVALFVKEAENRILEIQKRGKIPFVVGGCGLYIKRLTSGLFPSPTPDIELRERLAKKEDLYDELIKIDPDSATKISPGDRKRIIRALEVFYQTGKPISFLQREKTPKPKFRFVMIALKTERSALYRRINERVDRMIEEGWIDETKRLMEMGYGYGLSSMEGLGYRQIMNYLSGKIGLSEAILEIKKRTRQFAKRQLTWFSQDKKLLWQIPSEAENFLKRCNYLL